MNFENLSYTGWSDMLWCLRCNRFWLWLRLWLWFRLRGGPGFFGFLDLVLRGDGDHYSALVISEAFRGKSRVAQHQMVFAAMQGKMGGQLHAMALQTRAP